MLTGINSWALEGNFVLANLLLQLTFFSLFSLVLSSFFRNNAVVRYSILYTSLLSLSLLCVLSLAVQSRNAGLLVLQVAAPLGYFDYLLPQLDSVLMQESMGVAAGSNGAVVSVPTVANDLTESAFNSVLLSIINLPLSLIVQILWLSGFLVSTFGLLRSLHNADCIVRRSKSLKVEESQLLNSIVSHSGFDGAVFKSRESAEIDSPALVGIINPILLLPHHFFERFSENDIRAILRHEMAHVTRKDCLFNFLQKVILCLFWFHPLVHYMDKMIARSREEICDNYVLSKERASDYGEVLFRLNINQSLRAAQSDKTSSAYIGLGVVGGNWNLEQRIADLLNQKREKFMRLSQRSKILLNVSVVTAALAVSACQVTAQDDVSQPNENVATSQSQSPDNIIYPTLGPQIQAKISEIQDLMVGVEDSQPDWEGAKQELDALYEERFERMNDTEKLTLLNFFTNYYLSQESYTDAIDVFEQMLEVRLMRPDMHQRVLRSLGQLHAARQNWSESIRYYEEWQAASAAKDRVVSHGLSYAHYQLEQFDDALPTWLSYMELKAEEGAELVREDYSYLVGLHFTLENWDQALDVTKEMILMFNTPRDWENLRAVFRKLDEAEQPEAA